MIAGDALRTLGRRARNGPGSALLMHAMPQTLARANQLVERIKTSTSHLVRRAVVLLERLFPQANAKGPPASGNGFPQASTVTVSAQPTITAGSGLRVARCCRRFSRLSWWQRRSPGSDSVACTGSPRR